MYDAIEKLERMGIPSRRASPLVLVNHIGNAMYLGGCRARYRTSRSASPGKRSEQNSGWSVAQAGFFM